MSIGLPIPIVKRAKVINGRILIFDYYNFPLSLGQSITHTRDENVYMGIPSVGIGTTGIGTSTRAGWVNKIGPKNELDRDLSGPVVTAEGATSTGSLISRTRWGQSLGYTFSPSGTSTRELGVSIGNSESMAITTSLWQFSVGKTKRR